MTTARRLWWCTFLCAAALLIVSGIAQADGGIVQLAKRLEACRITVFTAPTPFRAGPVDISVLLQDPDTGEPINDTSVGIEATSQYQPLLLTRCQATREAATNKLFYAAKFDLPVAGPWEITVSLDGPRGQRQVRFALEAAEPLPRWSEVWLWIALPVVPTVFFGMQRIAGRRTGCLGRSPQNRPAATNTIAP